MGTIHWFRKLCESPYTVPGSMTISLMMPSISRCMQRNSSG